MNTCRYRINETHPSALSYSHHTLHMDRETSQAPVFRGISCPHKDRRTIWVRFVFSFLLLCLFPSFLSFLLSLPSFTSLIPLSFLVFTWKLFNQSLVFFLFLFHFLAEVQSISSLLSFFLSFLQMNSQGQVWCTVTGLRPRGAVGLMWHRHTLTHTHTEGGNSGGIYNHNVLFSEAKGQSIVPSKPPSEDHPEDGKDQSVFIGLK